MATDAQIHANRANAKRSTGPATEQGKATSAQNRLKYGFRGHFRILHFENPQEYAALLQAFKDEHQPATPTELAIVERMAEHHWLSRRAQFLQCSLFTERHFDTRSQRTFDLYLRYQTVNDHGFFRCLNQFLKLRNEKLKQEIGFERQKQAATEAARRQEAHETRTRTTHARANGQKLDSDLKQFLQTCLPEHTKIPYSILKTVLTDSIENFAAKLHADPALAKTLEAA